MNKLKLNEMNITELPKKFDKKGWQYKQIQNAFCYIYQVTDENHNIHYEVFTKKATPVCLNFERKEYSDTEHKHRYPNDKDFGVWAWNYRSLNSAYSKAGRVEKNQKPKGETSTGSCSDIPNNTTHRCIPDKRDPISKEEIEAERINNE